MATTEFRNVSLTEDMPGPGRESRNTRVVIVSPDPHQHNAVGTVDPAPQGRHYLRPVIAVGCKFVVTHRKE
jgi:hypothetical protein